MKKFFLTLMLVLAVVVPQSAFGVNYNKEVLNYEVVYHWGLIWKHAANATLSINKTSDGGYFAQLTGKTRSWADSLYPVRDTLKCTMNSKMQPLLYQKLTHEKNYYARDVVKFTNGNGTTSASCTRYRKSGTKQLSLSTKGQAYDMVSVFYMLRNLDYDKMNSKTSYYTTIFSGKEKESLTIRYMGVETIKMRNGSKRKAHRVDFHFTQDGGKKSSENITTWLSTDNAHIPLLFVGKLPVGEVKCYYSGK